MFQKVHLSSLNKNSQKNIEISSHIGFFFLFQITSGLVRLMQECWHEDQSARLSALRLKKSIQELIPENIPKLGSSANSNSIKNASFNRTNIHSATNTTSGGMGGVIIGGGLGAAGAGGNGI